MVEQHIGHVLLHYLGLLKKDFRASGGGRDDDDEDDDGDDEDDDDDDDQWRH